VEPRKVYFILDYVQGGDMSTLVHNQGKLNEEKVSNFAA
jgi:hypothetical protein